LNLADLGSAYHRARTAGIVVGGATVGFTSPLLIESEAGNIDRAARTLLGDMQGNLPASDPLRQSYEDWFQHTWTPFLASIKSFLFNASGGVLFGTDERFALLQTRRGELADFKAKYEAQVGKPSAAVIPSDPRTLPPTPPGGKPSGAPSWWPKFLTPPSLSIPWWVWVAGGAAVVGGGFLAYTAWKRAREERNAVLNVLPQLLHPGMPVAAPAAHDCQACGGRP
jgi:hypothetical protein